MEIKTIAFVSGSEVILAKGEKKTCIRDKCHLKFRRCPKLLYEAIPAKSSDNEIELNKLWLLDKQ